MRHNSDRCLKSQTITPSHFWHFIIYQQPTKGMEISCVSQASATEADRRPSSATASSSASLSLTVEQHLGGRAIDRHNPIIAESRRSLISLTLPAHPCTSSIPINPVPYHQLRPKAEKRNSISYSSKNEKRPTKQGSCSSPPPRLSPPNIFAGRFSCDLGPVKKKLDPKHEHVGFKSPPGSSRYLLSEADSFEGLSRVHNYVSKDSLVKSNQTGSDRSLASPKPEPTALVGSKSLPHQVVVVLRVSLHCKGCEGKVRKHLSRMAGVTSFNIDFAAKKVTIVGDVTPDGVLLSVSRVKNAQFWTSPAAVNK